MDTTMDKETNREIKADIESELTARLTPHQRIKLTIAYDGTNYCGWQWQKNAPAVENFVLDACKKLFSGDVKVTGASRTDAGVHADGQVATVTGETNIKAHRLARALSAYLPQDIVIQSAEPAPENFHPRFHAVEKTYIYRIYNAPMPHPRHSRFSHYFFYPLDIEKMRSAAADLIGEHDFAPFCAAGGSAKTTVRKIYDIQLEKQDDLIEISITGNGFLYNMVRIIVGTLIEIGNGIRPEQDMPRILASGDRKQAGPTAPAKGLTLKEIRYDENQTVWFTED